MRDISNETSDGKIFDKIAQIQDRSSLGDVSLDRPVPVDLFRKYVLYARSKPKPELSLAAVKNIREFYLQARKNGGNNNQNNGEKYPAISARSAAALLKITTAIARRELCSIATDEHAAYAIKLYTKSIISLGLGTEMDFNIVERGGTRSQLERIALIRSFILDKTRTNGGFATVRDIIEYTGYSEEEVRHTLKRLLENGDLINVRGDEYRVI
jgi:DNA replicative helicase MCM subunit Mcm2 (Cdc46/Mcm family)